MVHAAILQKISDLETFILMKLDKVNLQSNREYFTLHLRARTIERGKAPGASRISGHRSQKPEIAPLVFSKKDKNKEFLGG